MEICACLPLTTSSEALKAHCDYTLRVYEGLRLAPGPLSIYIYICKKPQLMLNFSKSSYNSKQYSNFFYA